MNDYLPGSHPYGERPAGDFSRRPFPQQYAGMPQDRRYPVVAPKNPGISLIVSFFLPGVGSMLNGSIVKGLFILFGFLLSCASMIVLIGLFTAPVFWIWGLIDAYQGAQLWNARHGIIS